MIQCFIVLINITKMLLLPDTFSMSWVSLVLSVPSILGDITCQGCGGSIYFWRRIVIMACNWKWPTWQSSITLEQKLYKFGVFVKPLCSWKYFAALKAPDVNTWNKEVYLWGEIPQLDKHTEDGCLQLFMLIFYLLWHTVVIWRTASLWMVQHKILRNFCLVYMLACFKFIS